MDVVGLNVELDDLPVFPLADRFEYPLDLAFHFGIAEYFAAIFGCPYDMIFQIVKTM